VTGACYGKSHIFSGGVTGRNAVLRFLSRERKLLATFASFQEADEVAIRSFRDYLAGNGNGFKSIAILSEDETEYGNSPVAGCPAQTDMHDLEAGRGCLYLHFPREISRLRAAYQSNGVGSSATEAQSEPHGALPLNLGISGDDDDTIPSSGS
jgi:hypothetical protein